MRSITGTMGLVVALLVAGAVPASAQWAIGAKGGITFADLSIDDAEDLDTDTRTGFNGGGFLEIPVGDVFAFQPGVYFTEKGTSFEEDGAEAEIRLNYVEIPVLGKFAVPTGGPVGIYFLGGPVVSFEAGCEVAVEGGGASLEVDCDEFDDGIDTKSTDFGVQVGAGIDFDISDGVALLLDGTYTFGLVNIDESPGAGDVKNRALSIDVGIRVPLGR